MKPLLRSMALAACFHLASCVTTTERITAPDGTITERKTQTVDAAAFTAGANAVTAIAAPRAVFADK